MGKIIQYEHHGGIVNVDEDQKGKHWEHYDAIQATIKPFGFKFVGCGMDFTTGIRDLEFRIDEPKGK